MDGVDVQQFISSHRDKLDQEKSRLNGNSRVPRSILPSGSQATETASRLRRERESEYLEFMKTKDRYDLPRTNAKRSISEIRSNMSRERDRELSTPTDANLVQGESREYDYSRIKEQRKAEERQYRNHGYDSGRARWSDEKPSVSFKEERNQRNDHSVKDSSWNAQESDLVAWSRQQHNTRRNKAITPPTHIPREETDHFDSKRSISAPTPPIIGGITTLGVGQSNLEAKRNRQKEYAESLRAQMREKEKSKHSEDSRVRQASPERRQASPQEKRTQRIKSPRKERDDPYAPYPPPPSHYPHYPPPPPPHPYYMPSYYGPPPRDMYSHPRPDPYAYPYYPPPQGYSNPYLPPHVPAHVPATRDRYDQHRRESAGSRREEVVKKKTEDPKVKGDVYTSPIHGDGGRTTRQDKTSYREELEKQMREKKERDLKTKLDREKYEQKKDIEIYDPFGKGGCGAPVRDQHGNLVADLKRMKKINDERTGLSPRESQEFDKVEEPDGTPRRSLDKSQDQTVLTYNKVEDDSQKKVVQESYRDYLRRQVEEKEAVKRKQKEAEMLEEKRELERMEKDRIKMKSDFKVEREKERLIELDTKQKNEILKKEAEEKRREAALKDRELIHQREIENRLLAEQKKIALVEKMAQPLNAPQQQQRSSSPPIPTLRKQGQQQQQYGQQQQEIQQQSSDPIHTQQHSTTNFQQTQSSSPPVPTVQHRMANQDHIQPEPQPGTHRQPDSFQTHKTTVQRGDLSPDPPTESKILSQLAAMRMHLQTQLADQIKTDRTIPPANANPKPSAPRMTSGPRVRRQHSGGMATAMDKFASLKYKDPFQNQEFLNQFPNPPRSESSLQVQQGAMLRYQEERMARIRKGVRNKENKPTIIGGLIPSDTHGVPLSSSDPFGPTKQDHLSLTKAQQHNGGRLRNTSAGGQSQFSIATLDVDGMAGRNEERMRRLDAILNAGSVDQTAGGSGYEPHGGVRSVHGGYEPGGGVRSVGGEDDESIIYNFLRRSDHGRQSLTQGSERSLDCDTVYH